MTEIKIKVSGKIALCRKRYLISSNENYKVTFEFDDEWKGHEAKTARFIFDSKYVDVAFLGNTVNIPRVIPCESLGIGVFTDTLASTAADVGCVLSVKDITDEEAGELTADQYETLLALLNELDLRQIKTIERIDGNVKIVYTDKSTSTFPIYDGVSVTGGSVSESGVLTLTLSNGTTVTAGNVKGEKGEKGDTGTTPSFSIGTVKTLEPGENAAASITGTAAAPILNLSLPQGSAAGGYFKKIFSGTLTEASKRFTFTTFADGSPLKYTELYLRGSATTNLQNLQNLNVYYGWEGDGKYNAYKVIGMIPYFCQPDGTDISAQELSLKAELLGSKIFNQYGYATPGGITKTEHKTSETDVFTQLAFWSGGNATCQVGSWFEVYAR